MTTRNSPAAEREGEIVVQPSLEVVFKFWLKLGFISFGGPAAQIALMHQEVVERRGWISEEQFLHALNFCMLLPGPEAQQLATYLGWLLHGVRGGLIAGGLFVLPSAVLLWGLSWLYVSCSGLPVFEGALAGLKPAMLAIVVCALVRLGRKTLKTAFLVVIALLTVGAVQWFHTPFPILVAGAALVGFLAGRNASNACGGGAGSAEVLQATEDRMGGGFLKEFLGVCRSACLGLAVWWAPVVLAFVWGGPRGVLFQMGVFFSKAAVVTFGGAYAVLPYVSQQAVDTFGWLTGPQMLDGLAFAETTPGPLLMVLEFVGFLGAWNQPGELPPLLAATLGAAMTVWCTFAPCFLWVFLGAPYVQRMREYKRLNLALSAVTAVVVGVIFNLTLWLGKSVLFDRGGSLNWTAAVLAAVVFVAVQRWKVGMVSVVLGAAAFGVASRWWT